MNRALTVARHDLLWLRREPAPVITMLLTPALLMFFIKPLYAGALDRLGYRGVSGAELAVPGMTVMFSFFMAGLVTESVFREHGLNTWARLRVSPLRDTELMTGKVAPCLALVMAQSCVLFLLGRTLMDLRVRGSLLALLAVMAALSACVVAFSFLLCAVARTRRQAFAYERVTTLVWVILGGTLVPTELMADWVGSLARFTPVYWASHGYREVILNGEGVAGVLPHIGVLCAFAALFVALAVWRFDGEADKQHWD
ncbi:ABC transporter permease [Streptomyces sp. NPDC060205]|uniref:ABC transporter permease n=1 Tax=Streptomyces sp. NPDC060205 TaxID=3347072 RepID=UPI00364BB024